MWVMAAGRPGSITELLQQCARGAPGAQDQLFRLVYRELRRLAASHLRRERPDHSLVATAVVHEMYLRLVGQKANYENRSHFFGVAASMMRRVLVDHARARAAAKRPRPELQVTLDGTTPSHSPQAFELLSVNEALDSLAGVDARQARIVELRYFGGLTAEETADVLKISLATVNREWKLARAWLFHQLTRADPTFGVASRPPRA
jgi:RNA polymerase sigma factor (TIGR02999 family)